MSKVKAAQGAVPRLRFPGFEDDWQSSSVAQTYTFKGNNSLSRDKLNYEDGPFQNIHYGDIHTKFSTHLHVQREPVPYINEGEWHSTIREENYCSAGDVVFADASEDTNDIGKAVEVISVGDVPLVSGLHTILARPVEHPFVLGFGAYLFSSESVRRQIQRESQGAKILGLSATRLGDVELRYPKAHKEQQKIVDCLSSLDARITAETRKLDALKTHKQGLMQQLFPAEGERTPRLRFPGFEGEWKPKKLGEICKVLQGYGFPEALQGKSSGKYPFCKVSDISRAVAESGGLLDCAANYIDDAELLQLRAKLIPARATVFAKIGEALRLNRRAIACTPCLIDNNAVGISAIEGLADDRFVFFLSQLIDLNSHCGGAVPSVNKTTLEAIEVLVPKVSEQQKIANCLSSLDTLIATQSRYIATLKQHKHGLMQGLFPQPETAAA